MWNDRYASDEYAYGTAPNDFLKEKASTLPQGKILCLAEGEGRNAVWLAEQGFDVTGVDASSVGLAKAQQLAEKRNVKVTTQIADLNDYDIGTQQWDGIVSIFCHVPRLLQEKLHKACVQGLKPGGVMLLEAYTPKQLNLKTGGPPSKDMMMDKASLQKQLTGLTFLHLVECDRDIQEGTFHHGTGSVVQLIARKL